MATPKKIKTPSFHKNETVLVEEGIKENNWKGKIKRLFKTSAELLDVTHDENGGFVYIRKISQLRKIKN